VDLQQMLPSVLSLPVRHLSSEERGLLLAGMTLLSTGVAALAVCWLLDEAAFLRIGAVIVAAVIGGRTPAILAGLEVGLGSGAIVALLILTNTSWLLLALPVFSLFHRRMVEAGALGGLLGAVEHRARKRKRLVATLGGWALAALVWLPLPMTGAFVGAIIGRLMGMPLIRLMVLVLASMWVGVASWTLGFEYLFVFGGLLGKVVCYGVTGVILVWSLALRVRGWREAA
jgi:uncharacterized membrane protein